MSPAFKRGFFYSYSSQNLTMTFTELGIDPLIIQALQERGIIHPTEIQIKALPFLLEKGSDFIGQAQTGTGKTAAFGLPILQHIDADKQVIQALILSPTRELGQQIAKQLFTFTKFIPKKIFTEAVYGGAPIGNQISALLRPTHILVATPGRLIDLIEKKAVDISNVKIVVLDEADEMLSMGFKDELTQILKITSRKKAIWLFSATMPPQIKDIIKNYMAPDAFRIEVAKKDEINRNIDHQFVICNADDKLAVLINFLKAQGLNRGVVFCKTKAGAQVLAGQLQEAHYNANAIHGDLLQKERDKVMRAFKNGKLQVLIATDLAARGIDVENLAYVVHFNLPEQIEYYTHRSGRTARAGRRGLSLSIITSNEVVALKHIERTLNINMKKIVN